MNLFIASANVQNLYMILFTICLYGCLLMLSSRSAKGVERSCLWFKYDVKDPKCLQQVKGLIQALERELGQRVKDLFGLPKDVFIPDRGIVRTGTTLSIFSVSKNFQKHLVKLEKAGFRIRLGNHHPETFSKAGTLQYEEVLWWRDVCLLDVRNFKYTVPADYKKAVWGGRTG